MEGYKRLREASLELMVSPHILKMLCKRHGIAILKKFNRKYLSIVDFEKLKPLDGYRYCYKCDSEQLKTDFPGKETQCRACIKKIRAKYYQDNKKMFRDYQTKWRSDNPEKCLEGRRRCYLQSRLSRRGMTEEHFRRLEAESRGLCMICGVAECKDTNPFHIDHDHKTNKIRGLICHNCNHGLGNFRDNVNFLYKTIQYLNKYSENNKDNNLYRQD